MIYQVDKLPANVEAERVLLGNVLLDNGAIPQALYQLSADDMSVDSNRIVFTAMRALDAKKRAVDVLTLQAELVADGFLERIGGPAYIASLFDGVPRLGNLGEYVRLLKEASMRRKAMKVGNWLFQAALDDGAEPDSLLATLDAKVEELREGQAADDLISSESAVARTMEDLERRWESGGSVIGLASGFPDLDRVLLGFRGGKYYTLAAGTGIGKTTLALNFACRMVADDQRVGLVISLEMSTDELTVKTLSTFTKINAYKIETGDLSVHEKQFVREKAEEVKRLSLEYVEGFSKVTATSLAARVAKVRRKHGRLDFLIVDYLQLLDSDERRENEHLRLSEISRTLKRIAIMHNIPVIVLSQLNREFSKRANKDHQLSDLRGSGSLEQDSDVVLFLMPADWDDEDNPGRRLFIAKHRGGKKNTTINLMFFGEQSRFESAAIEHSQIEKKPANSYRAVKKQKAKAEVAEFLEESGW